VVRMNSRFQYQPKYVHKQNCCKRAYAGRTGILASSVFLFLLPKVNLQPLIEIFRADVLKMLKKKD